MVEGDALPAPSLNQCPPPKGNGWLRDMTLGDRSASRASGAALFSLRAAPPPFLCRASELLSLPQSSISSRPCPPPPFFCRAPEQLSLESRPLALRLHSASPVALRLHGGDYRPLALRLHSASPVALRLHGGDYRPLALRLHSASPVALRLHGGDYRPLALRLHSASPVGGTALAIGNRPCMMRP